jgi:hypothetical protein
VDFVAESTYTELPSPNEEGKLFEVFLNYLRRKDYKYNPTEAALNDLEMHPQSPEMRTPIANLRRIQNTLVAADITEFREEITRRLLDLIQEVRIGGSTTAATRLRTSDDCLQTAVDYLKKEAS